jgi:hypothetical protein
VNIPAFRPDQSAHHADLALRECIATADRANEWQWVQVAKANSRRELALEVRRARQVAAQARATGAAAKAAVTPGFLKSTIWCRAGRAAATSRRIWSRFVRVVTAYGTRTGSHWWRC